MSGRRFESGFSDSTGRSRSACDSQTPTSLPGAHSRTAVDPSDPALHTLGGMRHVSSWLGHDASIVKEPHTKTTEDFPLELRAKTLSTPQDCWQPKAINAPLAWQGHISRPAFASRTPGSIAFWAPA